MEVQWQNIIYIQASQTPTIQLAQKSAHSHSVLYTNETSLNQ